MSKKNNTALGCRTRGSETLPVMLVGKILMNPSDIRATAVALDWVCARLIAELFDGGYLRGPAESGDGEWLKWLRSVASDWRAAFTRAAFMQVGWVQINTSLGYLSAACEEVDWREGPDDVRPWLSSLLIMLGSGEQVGFPRCPRKEVK